MILFILLAFLISKIRGDRIRPVFKEYSLLPIVVAEILFWYFQVCAWTGNYRYIEYASYLQTMYILVLIWPMLKFRLYNHAIGGAVMVAVGSLMNRAVMEANAGKMPVLPTLSKLTGYFKAGSIEAAQDVRHCLMTQETKLVLLGDYIDVGFSIMSPGDLLIHGFMTLVICGVIHELNRKGID